MALNTTEYERMRANLRQLDERTRDFNLSLATFRARRPPHSAAVFGLAAAVPLTPREREILRLVAAGRENTEIAEELHFALGTIKMHVRDILDKLDASSRTEAAVRAVRLSLI